jgi:hypothetical protein
MPRPPARPDPLVAKLAKAESVCSANIRLSQCGHSTPPADTISAYWRAKDLFATSSGKMQHHSSVEFRPFGVGWDWNARIFGRDGYCDVHHSDSVLILLC